jgi:hypothetical protein
MREEVVEPRGFWAIEPEIPRHDAAPGALRAHGAGKARRTIGARNPTEPDTQYWRIAPIKRQMPSPASGRAYARSSSNAARASRLRSASIRQIAVTVIAAAAISGPVSGTT